jgi:hypothetical protein
MNDDIEEVDRKDAALKQWECVFNELCTDGVLRSVVICPRCVMRIERCDPPHKIGDGTASSAIIYRAPQKDYFDINEVRTEREIFLFESFEIITSALGTSIAACDIRTDSLYHAKKIFAEHNIKYSLDFERPLSADGS